MLKLNSTPAVKFQQSQSSYSNPHQRPVHDALSAAESVHPSLDYEVTYGLMPSLATLRNSATSSSNPMDFSSSSQLTQVALEKRPLNGCSSSSSSNSSTSSRVAAAATAVAAVALVVVHL